MMELSIVNIAILIAGGVALLVFLVFYVLGFKHNAMFEVLDSKEYPLKEIYGMGYAVLETFHYRYKSNKDRKLRQALVVLYGKDYVEYYLRAIRAQQITFGASLMLLSFVLYGFTGEILILVAMIAIAGAVYYYFGDISNKKVSNRSEKIISDFNEVISKLALLINAGMILREAWQEVARAGDTTIYIEMQKAVDEMDNGVAEVDAIQHFATRCVVPEIKKFSSTIIQGIAKGNRELAVMLQEQSKEVMHMKRQLVKRAGEKASSKLMIPITIIFIGILIMILVPIMSNLGI